VGISVISGVYLPPMRAKKKDLPIMEKVSITEAAAEGKALARVENMVVFVDNAVPGDVADLQVTRKKSNYREARAINFHVLSDKRTEPACSHFGVCGGCKWQNMQYQHQLFYKQKQVKDNLERLGKVPLPEIFPILGSENEYYYRNKLEFTFSHRGWMTDEEIKSGENFGDRPALGFHIPGMFDKILDIKKCFLQPEPSNAVRDAVKKYAVENGLEFFNTREQTGFLRNIIIRNTSTGELMVNVIFAKEDKEKREGLLNFISSQFPVITSLLFTINTKRNDTINDLEVQSFKGPDYIMEEMPGFETTEKLKFKIGAKSFFQTNTQQAYRLYKIAAEFAELKNTDLVYDLYTGTGTIACFVAGKAKKVVGIEYVPTAIEDAKENAALNNISNTSFVAGDMKDVLSSDFVKENGKPDVIITDPPRAGMHEDVVKRLLEIEARRIVYVSCNPATQARDIALLAEKYSAEKVQPVDMFPHTHHVENVVSLVRR
jgi:23S rRNA (uracil1939-C5)-methyltransferase